jgi:hypothetical protein
LEVDENGLPFVERGKDLPGGVEGGGLVHPGFRENDRCGSNGRPCIQSH